MTALVVDASVVAAAFSSEPLRAEAASILSSRRRLLAPDLLVAEVGNVAWKRYRRGELSGAEAEALMADVLRLPIELIPSGALVGAALPLAIQSGRSVYDCLCLALAVEHATTMITGDRRLVNGLASSPLAPYVRWLGDA